jgi:arylformamidase
VSFDDLPPLPPLIHAEGQAYAKRILDWSRQAQSTMRTVLDQPYGTDYWQKVDFYLPDANPGGRALPVLCLIHGGAWANGYKEWMGFMAPAFCSLPAIVVSISHRLAPGTKFPEPLNDVLDALAYVARRAPEFGGDPARVFLSGHSSGGHLAALATVRVDLARERGVPANVPVACFPLSAPYDLSSDDPVRRQKVLAFLADFAQHRDASPLFHVHRMKTPFLVAWGTNDLPEVITQGAAMGTALREAGCRVETMPLEGLAHFQTHEVCRDPNAPWVHRVREWMTAGDG